MLVALLIGVGMILSGLNKFGACITIISAIFMVPIHFIIPCLMYCAIYYKSEGGFAGMVKKIGYLSIFLKNGRKKYSFNHAPEGDAGWADVTAAHLLPATPDPINILSMTVRLDEGAEGVGTING